VAIERLTAWAVCGFARALTGARAMWKGCAPVAETRVYYGNHSSHADFVLIWAALPVSLRVRTRPVAGADYWGTSRLRRWLMHEVFRAVLIDRVPSNDRVDPVARMAHALEQDDSLILFPEGTRNTTDEILLPLAKIRLPSTPATGVDQSISTPARPACSTRWPCSVVLRKPTP